MPQKHILLSFILMACSSVHAADAVDSGLTSPTTPAEQTTQKPDQTIQSGVNSEGQPKATENSTPKRSRFEQDNFQQSTSNAQDLFQGDHN